MGVVTRGTEDRDLDVGEGGGVVVVVVEHEHGFADGGVVFHGG